MIGLKIETTKIQRILLACVSETQQLLLKIYFSFLTVFDISHLIGISFILLSSLKIIPEFPQKNEDRGRHRIYFWKGVGGKGYLV